jgi:hypothetical protein
VLHPVKKAPSSRIESVNAIAVSLANVYDTRSVLNAARCGTAALAAKAAAKAVLLAAALTAQPTPSLLVPSQLAEPPVRALAVPLTVVDTVQQRASSSGPPPDIYQSVPPLAVTAVGHAFAGAARGRTMCMCADELLRQLARVPALIKGRLWMSAGGSTVKATIGQ